MKKFILPILAVLGLLCGCQKSASSSGEVDVTLNVTPSVVSKATLDGDGAAANVNRYILEIYTDNGATFYNRLSQGVTAGTTSAQFTFKLVVGQTYTFLVWADCANADGSDLYYKTDVNLKAVAMMGTYKGNDDSRDAFSQCVTLINVTSDPSTSVQLERPFAQLNIITQDIDDIEANSGTVKVVPDLISVAFTAPTVFNVKTQEASASAAFTSNVAPYYSTVGSQTEHYTLSMDYILASKNQQDVKDVELTAKKNSTVLNTQTFSNIPLQRNYRTNILGNLLTTTGVFTVETAPVWASPENNENK